MKGLKGLCGVVTGGSAGIGLSVVQRLVEEGCSVGVLDIQDFPSAEHHSGVMENIHFVKCDITNDAQIDHAIIEIAARFGALSFLVNNAVNFILKGLDASSEEIDEICRTNIRGTSRVTHYMLPYLKQNFSGSIVNVSSISGFVGQENFATYTSTKFAIRGFVRSWAVDLAKENIRVNSVCPGCVETDGFLNAVLKMGMTVEQARIEYGKTHLLERIARPFEIASAIVFLLSDEASFITGTDLVVDGGYLASVEKNIEKNFS